MENSLARWIVWVALTLILSMVILLIPTTETPETDASSARIGAGWTEVTGELLNIKCADPEPVKIEYRGMPFAHQETEYICTGENEIQASRSNTLALFLDVATAGIITGLVIGLYRILGKKPQPRHNNLRY